MTREIGIQSSGLHSAGYSNNQMITIMIGNDVIVVIHEYQLWSWAWSSVMIRVLRVRCLRITYFNRDSKHEIIGENEEEISRTLQKYISIINAGGWIEIICNPSQTKGISIKCTE
jgi:hypothetical protein